MFCQQCHTILRDDAKFCTNCGSKQENIPQSRFYQAATLPLFPSWREDLQTCAHNVHLDQLEEVLKKLGRDSNSFYKLAASSLFDQSMETLCPPHRVFGDNTPKNFESAKKYTTSKYEADKEVGVKLFERMKVGKTLGPHSLVNEWYLFAKASAYGPAQAVEEWDERWQKEQASWDEVWNLAVSYIYQSDFGHALAVLRRGIESREAPFSHLRFALYCALRHLILSIDKHEAATDFLKIHFLQWPLPECYTGWLLLKIRQSPLRDTFNSRELSASCKTLYSLLTQPVTIPDPTKVLEKKTVQDLIKLLESLDATETLIFWLNDYIKYHCAKFGRRAEHMSTFQKHDFEIWQSLSSAYERDAKPKDTERILSNLAHEQKKIFLRQRKDNGEIAHHAFPPMRDRLIALFEFYQRHQMLHEEQVFDTFIGFYESVSELWEAEEGRNKKLIGLTEPLLEKLRQTKSNIEIASQQKEAALLSLVNHKNAHLSIQPLIRVKQQVGIFVDLENVAYRLQDTKVQNIGMALFDYAAQLGEVACRWAAADLRNLGETMPFLTQLKRAGFQPRHPRDEPQAGKADKSAADFALIEVIHQEKCRIKPDIYIIASGDKHFYECIMTLIDSGATVHLCASLSQNHIAEKYKRLQDERYRIRHAQHLESDFFIDDLDCILCGTSDTL